MKKDNLVYLSLGSNMGNSIAQMEAACAKIESSIGKIIQQSSLFTTAAWGNTQQPDFVNQVILVETGQHYQDVMLSILRIEQEMGRVRTIKNAPRIIDIDILFYNNAVVNEENLHIPHPLLQERNFVLTPLMELSPDFVHPVLHQTIRELMDACADKLPVKKN